MGALTLQLDDYDLTDFLPVAAKFGSQRYGFVVTPNVDHLIRFHEQPQFRDCYGAATYVLLDSRFASRLLRLVKGMSPRVCTGSDLTAAVLATLVTNTDRILVIGSNPTQVQALRERYQLHDLHHHNPPMGFIKDAAAVEECLDYIEKLSPFRFCFLAVGSPQQEIIAHELQKRGRARGLALCIGASIDFLTGKERRAPMWMQQASIEWLYRLTQNPRRLAWRYLVRGPRVFAQMVRFKFVLRDRIISTIPEPTSAAASPGAPLG
ncbi:MAG TPA: WecB/TagA/CpsF family glycosyltransferase [Steroidobacteraceae bacterium]